MVYVPGTSNPPFAIAFENTRNGNGLSLNSRFSMRKLVFKRQTLLGTKENARKQNKGTVFLSIQPLSIADTIREWQKEWQYIPGTVSPCFPVFCCETANCATRLRGAVSINGKLLMVTDFVPVCQSRLCRTLIFSSKSYDQSRDAALYIPAMVVILSGTFPYPPMGPTDDGRGEQAEPSQLTATLSGAGEVEQNRYVSVTNARFPAIAYLFFRIGAFYMCPVGEMLDRLLIPCPKSHPS